MSPESISAFASSIGVVVAIGALIIQDRRTAFSNAIVIAAQLDARFETREFRELRRLAASYLDGINRSQQALEALLTVLNFFDTLGFLVRKRALTTEIVWHHFGSWLLPYHFASASVISTQRTFDPSCFVELEALTKAVTALERTKRRDSASTHTLIEDAAIRNLLKSEHS